MQEVFLNPPSPNHYAGDEVVERWEQLPLHPEERMEVDHGDDENEEKDSAFCFLCEHQCLNGQNVLWTRLQSMFQQLGKGSREHVYRCIYRFYKENFYDEIKKEWTLKSIRRHALEHVGLPHRTIMDMVIQDMTIITNNLSGCVLSKNTDTGEVRPNPNELKLYLSCTEKLLKLVKEVEQL